MSDGHYILDDEHRVIPADMMTWAAFFSDFENRRVAESFTEFYRISTVFLGLDHQWGKGPPLVFESMAFDLGESIAILNGREYSYHEEVDCCRYSSWDDAIAGHRAMTRRMRAKEAQAWQKAKRISEALSK